MTQARNEVVASDAAPKAIGPYSQAIACGEWLFTSGQIALDPATGPVVPGGIAEQTRRVLDNLKAVLTAGGSSLDRVVKTTVYLKDLAEFGAMNEAYAAYFTGNPPARSTVEVARLPRDVRVEIDAVARRG
ncbi:MAG: RidA family protein [Planctomycetes bacterium]|nr:RidA family protein [Planctomycetota bacterium]